jgi:nuclear pore complex protein Nup107
MLPAELSSITEPAWLGAEYLHYRLFFNVWDTMERVVECVSLEVLQMGRETRLAWMKDYEVSGCSDYGSWRVG